MNTELFDFGFTVVDESELEAVQQLQSVSSDADDYHTRLDTLYNANRLDKIEEFETHIQNIYKGS